jgi:hypothetical protein
MDAKQARSANFAALANRYPTLRAFAEAAGLSPAHASQIRGAVRSIGDDIARRIEERLRLPHGWMDQPHPDQGETTPLPREPDPREQALLGHWRALTAAQQDEVLRELQATESLNEALLAQLLARQVAAG